LTLIQINVDDTTSATTADPTCSDRLRRDNRVPTTAATQNEIATPGADARSQSRKFPCLGWTRSTERALTSASTANHRIGPSSSAGRRSMPAIRASRGRAGHISRRVLPKSRRRRGGSVNPTLLNKSPAGKKWERSTAPKVDAILETLHAIVTIPVSAEP